MTPKIRVMLVDDSAVIRGLVDRALRADPTIEIVASAGNGETALTMLRTIAVDVMILDIEMPVMDGITALPQLLKLSPKTRIIMASTLTSRNAEISLKALELGAADYIPKPSTKELGEVDGFYRDLITKIHALAPKDITVPPVSGVVSPASGSVKSHGLAGAYVPIAKPTNPVRQSESPPMVTHALAIASSTGGPQALLEIFRHFKGITLRVPIFITQHMPPNFTTILAGHIAKTTAIDCHEAIDGEAVVGGKIYVAPGDYHMTVVQADGTRRIRLHQEQPENFCRPSADPMLRSLAPIYREKLLVAVLTGLGADGARGAAEAVALGATVIAQDEATSVVYGMPKAVVEAKLTSAVFPLNRIAPYLMKAVI